MMDYFFNQTKPVKSTGREIGELIILLPTDTGEPLLDCLKGKKTMHIACPTKIMAKDLIERIHGVNDIAIENIMLFYCGWHLENEEMIPNECFETGKIVSEDEDLFRPRLVFVFKKIIEEEEEPNMSEMGEETENSEEAAANEALRVEEAAALAEALAKEQAEKVKQREERLAAVEAVENAKLALHAHDFDLFTEMHKIACSQFAGVLERAGYGDEGAFSNVTDEILRGFGMWIPHTYRKRILALALASKRRIMSVDKEMAITELSQIEDDMVHNHKIGNITMGGQGTAMNHDVDSQLEETEQYHHKKVDISRQWEKQQKALAIRVKKEAYRLAHLKPTDSDAVGRKTHVREVSDKIAAIRRRCAHDDCYIPESCDLGVTTAGWKKKKDRAALPTQSKEEDVEKTAEGNSESSGKSPVQDNKPVGSTVPVLFAKGSVNDLIHCTIKEYEAQHKLEMGEKADEEDPPTMSSAAHEILRSKSDLIAKSRSECGGIPMAKTEQQPEDADTNAPSYTKFHCCQKHSKEVNLSQRLFIMQRKKTNENDLKQALFLADSYKNGFVSREVLQVILTCQLKKMRHVAFSDFDMGVLLNACVMTHFDQLEKEAWAVAYERNAKLALIPIRQYDAQLFVRLSVELLAKIDHFRYL